MSSLLIPGKHIELPIIGYSWISTMRIAEASSPNDLVDARCSADDDISCKLSMVSILMGLKLPINVFSSEYKLGNFGTGNISCDAEFSVAASAKVGTEIKIGPQLIYAAKYLSVIHRFLQMSPLGRVILEDNHRWSKLSWTARLNLCKKFALGLNFLGQRTRPFFNRDFKASNILLDANSVSKLADYGTGNSSCDVKFSMVASAEGGQEIKIGSYVIHLPKFLSVHHPVLQMLVFACKRSEDTFACVKSMAPKNVFEMAKRLYSSALQNVRQSSWISVNPKPEAHNAATDSESSTKKSIGRRNDPNACIPGRGMKSVEAKPSAAWTVATSAPHHATGNRALLSGFITEHEDQFVHAIDGVPMEVLARGAVVTDAMVLPDVWFVPGLTENLVSVSQLAQLDYSVGFGCGECCIRSAAGGKIVGKACLREGGLYVLDFLKIPLAM